ncbi:hypothetical protein [Leptospira ilyithenensis]|uniref:Lipoprotein n=1 Tax=Leptospira ilyithenensis TaxID=2484901 RepID=A0A4R9LJL3_9LEPT|nr:hypothetical protein [Leptospira ilyithenensis]TGN07023.1 hypothetical protein EHS11_18025 [Leptospira ilyithenensis]
MIQSKPVSYKMLTAIMLFSLLGCAQLQTVSMTPQPFPKDREVPIQADVSKFVFLAFNFNNDFLEEIPAKLTAQCPTGKITGLFTKYEIIQYVLAYRMNVIAKGYCVK